MEKYPVKLEHICEVEAYASIPIFIGPAGQGTRLIFPSAEGGSLTGPLLNGSLRSVGGDWAKIRPDYGFELDVRLIIDTPDGAVIYVSYSGIIDMDEAQINQFMSGIIPKNLKIFINPKFETSHEDYMWLNKAHVIGMGVGQNLKTGFNINYSWYVAR